MRTKIFALAALLGLLFTGGAAPDIDKMRFVYLNDLDYVYRMGRDMYCYWELKSETDGVSWDALYSKARAEMNGANSLKDYYRIMTEMFSGVHDGHVNFMPKSGADLPNYYYMPVSLRMAGDGRVIVSKIDRTAFLNNPDISVGDEVLAINDEPVGKLLDTYVNMISGSTDGMRKQNALMWLSSWPLYLGAPSQNSVLTLRSFSGAGTHKVEMPWLIYEPAKDPTFVKKNYEMRKDVEARILPGNIGYFHLGAMSPRGDDLEEKYEKYVVEQFETLLGTNALIIDVRGNGGGSTNTSYSVVAHFIDKPTVMNTTSLRLSKATLIEKPWQFTYEPDIATGGRFSKWMDEIIDPVDESLRYRGKTIVLTNQNCFSACDIFADAMASNGLAMMMGERTGGGSGAPLAFGLPSGIADVRFSTMRRVSNFGRFIEGTGTIPDVPASFTLEDIALGRDSVLIKAYNILAKPLMQTKADLSAGAVATMKDAEIESSPVFSLRDEEILPAPVIEAERIELSNHEGDASH